MAMFLISTAIVKLTLTGVFNIGIDIPFWIIFGIILGPFKGAFLAVICDTISQMMFSKTGLGTWMIEYAIIPLLVAVISSLIYVFYRSKPIIAIIVLSLLLFAVLMINFYVISIHDEEIYRTESQKIPRRVFVISTIVFTALIIIVWDAMIIIYVFDIKKMHKTVEKYLFSLLIVSLIIVLFRWIWGPYAYIAYYNHFYAGLPNNNGVLRAFKPIKDNMLIFAIPIIFKSTIEIPIYATLLAPIISVLFYLKNKSEGTNNNNKWI